MIVIMLTYLSREQVRQHFYRDAVDAMKGALAGGHTRMQLRCIIPELNVETDVYRVGYYLMYPITRYHLQPTICNHEPHRLPADAEQAQIPCGVTWDSGAACQQQTKQTLCGCPAQTGGHAAGDGAGDGDGAGGGRQARQGLRAGRHGPGRLPGAFQMDACFLCSALLQVRMQGDMRYLIF